MTGEEVKCYLTFPTTHHALAAEKAFQEKGLAVRLVPIPRDLSASCGLAARYSCSLQDRVEEVIEAAGLRVEGRHQLVENPRRSLWDKFLDPGGGRAW